jgi:flavin reductase (DIM6/NTAB) family NADH-FMN oxidoreductase RutF
VTYLADGEPHGITVNSFISVSMEPPLVLVSIARTARANAGLTNRPFTVNVLASDQLDVAMTFAGRPMDGTRLRWVRAGEGTPRLRGTAAWFQCAPWSSVEAGDHVLFLGRVAAHDQLRVDPLVFQTGQFRALGPPLESQASDEAGMASPVQWLHHKAHAERLADEGTAERDHARQTRLLTRQARHAAP